MNVALLEKIYIFVADYFICVGNQKVPFGRSGPDVERSAVRMVRGGSADGPRVRRVS
jgi:hypothetical protein